MGSVSVSFSREWCTYIRNSRGAGRAVSVSVSVSREWCTYIRNSRGAGRAVSVSVSVSREWCTYISNSRGAQGGSVCRVCTCPKRVVQGHRQGGVNSLSVRGSGERTS